MKLFNLRHDSSKKLMIHAVLISYTLIALFPIWVVIINLFTRLEIISKETIFKSCFTSCISNVNIFCFLFL